MVVLCFFPPGSPNNKNEYVNYCNHSHVLVQRYVIYLPIFILNVVPVELKFSYLDALCYKPEIVEHKRMKVPISIRTENHRILTNSGQSSNERLG